MVLATTAFGIGLKILLVPPQVEISTLKTERERLKHNLNEREARINALEAELEKAQQVGHHYMHLGEDCISTCLATGSNGCRTPPAVAGAFQACACHLSDFDWVLAVCECCLEEFGSQTPSRQTDPGSEAAGRQG